MTEHGAGPSPGTTPAPWLTHHADLLPRAGTALDVACGRGRHAFWLAMRGLDVVAIDRDRQALDDLARNARARGLRIDTLALDLEQPDVSLGHGRYDVIVVVHYLHRRLFPALIEALTPRGVLVYETFTRDQAVLGRPSNPDFLLDAGELPRLVQPLHVVDGREGFFDGRHVASVIAMPADAPPARTPAR